MALTANFPDIVAGLGINGFSGGNRARSAEVNSYVLEPLLYLKASPYARVVDQDGTVGNTTSTSFVDAPGASCSIDTDGTSRLAIWGHITGHSGGNFTSLLQLAVDGAAQGDATYGVASHVNLSSSGIPGGQMLPFFWLTAGTFTAGAHTVKLQDKTQSGGTFTIVTFALNVLEVA